MFNSDVVKLEDGIGEKLASFIFYQAAFFSSVIMALIMGWKLALLCLVTFPVTLFLVGLAGLVRLKKLALIALTLWCTNLFIPIHQKTDSFETGQKRGCRFRKGRVHSRGSHKFGSHRLRLQRTAEGVGEVPNTFTRS